MGAKRLLRSEDFAWLRQRRTSVETRPAALALALDGGDASSSYSLIQFTSQASPPSAEGALSQRVEVSVMFRPDEADAARSAVESRRLPRFARWLRRVWATTWELEVTQGDNRSSLT